MTFSFLYNLGQNYPMLLREYQANPQNYAFSLWHISGSCTRAYKLTVTLFKL